MFTWPKNKSHNNKNMTRQEDSKIKNKFTEKEMQVNFNMKRCPPCLEDKLKSPFYLSLGKPKV